MFKIAERVSIVTEMELREFPFEAWPDDAKQMAYHALSRPHNLARIQLMADHNERREAIIQMVETEQAQQMRFQQAMLNWLAK